MNITTRQIKQLIERAESGQILRSDLKVFLEDPTRWRQQQEVQVQDGLQQTQSTPAPSLEGLRAWMQGVYKELGIECQVPEVPKLTKKQLRSLERFTFQPFFVPTITEDAYPECFIRPKWGQYLTEAEIERKPLPGSWVAFETIPKPNWNDSVGYADDRLRQALKIESRFRHSWDDLRNGELFTKLTRVTGFPKKKTRLPTLEEWNFLANLMDWLRKVRGENLPDLGVTNSWEWCENVYDSEYRLVTGDRDNGGLAYVDRDWHGCTG